MAVLIQDFPFLGLRKRLSHLVLLIFELLFLNYQHQYITPGVFSSQLFHNFIWLNTKSCFWLLFPTCMEWHILALIAIKFL